jgi:hypothetical protein
MVEGFKYGQKTSSKEEAGSRKLQNDNRQTADWNLEIQKSQNSLKKQE